jgi:hypothetical protein
MSEYDSTFAFVPMDQLQKFRGMTPDAVSSIQMKLKPGADLVAVRDQMGQHVVGATRQCERNPVWADELPPVLRYVKFDAAVNSGPRQAVLWLQRACGVPNDGVIGPRTARAAHLALAEAPEHLVDAYGIARRNYYYTIGDRRPASRKFARRRDGGKGGWITRAEEFMAPRWHLSEAEHRARVAAWG